MRGLHKEKGEVTMSQLNSRKILTSFYRLGSRGVRQLNAAWLPRRFQVRAVFLSDPCLNTLNSREINTPGMTNSYQDNFQLNLMEVNNDKIKR